MDIRRTGLAAACLVACLLGGGVATAGPDEEYVLRVKEGLVALDREKIVEFGTDPGSQTDEALASRQSALAGGRKIAHQNWRRVQAAAEVINVAGRLVELRWAHHALAMWTIEAERKERIDAIHARENEITVARYGEPYYSVFVPKKSRPWRNDPEFPKFRAEETQVQAWFVGALQQQKGEAEGGDASTAAKLLDELRKETMEDVALVQRSAWAVEREIAKRKGIDLKTPQELAAEEAALENERDEEHRRHAVRLVPYRTEYAAATGEVVEAMFQVFKGAPSYVVAAHHAASLEGPRFLAIAASGDFVVPFTFGKAGAYSVDVRAYDAGGETASASITITVTGAPLPKEKKRAPPPTVKEGDPTPPTPPSPPTPPAAKPEPFSGTFSALVWHANAKLADPTPAALRITPVPVTLTIDPSGAIKASARYVMPEAEMKPLTDPSMFGRHWRSSFDLSGTVDWATGKVQLLVTGGRDEAGYEKTDSKLGHWRHFHRMEYACSLQGWTIPGPDAAAWLERLEKVPGFAEQLKQIELETLTGLPNPTVGADGRLSFSERGFFGASDLGPTPGPGTFRRMTYVRCLEHMGYDGRNEKDTDETAARQKREDSGGGGAWHIRILGPVSPPTEDAAEPDPKSDVLAFGLWPTKPITTKVGQVVRAQAMTVYRENVFQAVDRSKAVTWTADGLTALGDGSFRATRPGTYTITARSGDGPGAMTSTITVTVLK